MRTVLVISMMAGQLVLARPPARSAKTPAKVVVLPPQCTFHGPPPSRSLRAMKGEAALAHIEVDGEAMVEIDTRSETPVAAARVDAGGWHLSGFFAIDEAVGPAAPMWFGKSVVVNAKTALRLVGNSAEVTVEPVSPWWLGKTLKFSPTLRRAVACEDLTLARIPDIEDPVDAAPLAKALGLPWGPSAGLVDVSDAGAAFAVLDDEGQEVVRLQLGRGMVLPVHVVAREGGRAKVVIADPTFAVVGWVDAAAVVDAKERKRVDAKRLPPPTHTVCRTPTQLTVTTDTYNGEFVVGTLDADAPFTLDTPPNLPQYSAPPRDFEKRLYISGASLKIFPAGNSWVLKPAEMKCATE